MRIRQSRQQHAKQRARDEIDKFFRHGEGKRVKGDLFGSLKATKKQQLRALPDDCVQQDEGSQCRVVTDEAAAKAVGQLAPPGNTNTSESPPGERPQLNEVDE